MPHQRVWFLSHFGLKMRIDFNRFGSKVIKWELEFTERGMNSRDQGLKKGTRK